MTNLIAERRHARVPETGFVGQRPGLVARLQHFLLRREADALLRRTLRPHKGTAAGQLSPHLLKDIGLPPDFRL